MDRLLYNTTLWKTFVRKADVTQQATVKELTEKAAHTLDYVRDTFPTYTLHNETHILNVVNLMGELLGERINDLTSLEAAILLLSAYYHDIGMVFTEEDRNNILDEPEFEQFLYKYPSAQIQLIEYQKKHPNEISEDLAEWYCRWIHPTRSAFITMENPRINWEGHPINNALAAVCKSHGESTQSLLNDKELTNKFLGDTDLIFCSIILRLADILDFDNTRSPDEVYKFLGLSKRETKRKKISDIEWLKHLASGGFKFNEWKKDERYTLNFSAAPTEPAVEYDVREFIKIIEHEIDQCDITLKQTSAKWQTFKLPHSINKTDIHSVGYTYGEFKFTLEQDQIMNLLMGENLYSDKYVFIRELAQNAIDTTRHRVAHEQSNGVKDYIPEPVAFSTWVDNEGYTWVRVDDYGMGMDEEILIKYFLKVGQSYYQSDQFKLDRLKLEQNGVDFMPISRFGIGILSCFIVGDKLEVSTRRITGTAQRNALRMTIENFQEFFILKKEDEKHSAAAMPNINSKEERYRPNKKYGTSIAVRLSPKKDDGELNLKEKLNNYIFCSSIPVILNDKPIGKDYTQLVLDKWTKPFTYILPKKQQLEIEKFIKGKFSNKIKLIVRPLDISANKVTDNLLGQGVFCYLTIPDIAFNNIQDESNYRGFSLKVHPRKKILYISFRKNRKEKDMYDDDDDYDDYQQYYFEDDKVVLDIEIDYEPISEIISIGEKHLSHNGIVVPSNTSLYSNNSIALTLDKKNNFIFFAHISLTDSIRPNLSISRDSIKSMPWQYYCQFELTVKRALNKATVHKEILNTISFHSHIDGFDLLTFDALENNYTIENEWSKEAIYLCKEKKVNIAQLKKEKNLDGRNILGSIDCFEDVCIRYLIQKNLNIQVNLDEHEVSIVDNNVPTIQENIKEYPPLFFIPYSNNNTLKVSYYPLNSNHAFCKWLIKNTTDLRTSYPALFNKIMEILLEKNEYRFRDRSNRITETNKILDKLKELQFPNSPPKSIYLKPEDFEL